MSELREAVERWRGNNAGVPVYANQPSVDPFLDCLALADAFTALAELVTPEVKERFHRLNRVRNGEAAIDVYQPVPVGYVRNQQYAIPLLTMQIAEDHSELADFASRVIELIGGEK